MTFSHLSIHTHFSVADSVVRPDELANAARERGISALALTDLGNMFAMLKFYKACRQNQIKPILGADLRCDSLQDDHGDVDHASRFIVLAQNGVGFINLKKLISYSYRDAEKLGVISFHKLASYNEGLICLSGGKDGEIGRLLLDDRDLEAREATLRYKEAFGDRFYLEVSRTGRRDETRYNHLAVLLADELGIPLIATNDVCMIKADQHEAHGARISIGNPVLRKDDKWREKYSDQQYLRSSEEMQKVFADLPDALSNAVEVAKRCNLILPTGEVHLPKLTDLEDSAENVLTEKVNVALSEYIEQKGDNLQFPESAYRERLESELATINSMGFADYFLIVHQIVVWAKEQKIPVGPGRGSGGGSLVALLLDITMLDPLELDLLFERFLNPDRVSLPDFDIDICQQRRGEVINYIIDLFGRDRVGLIVTFNSLGARSVIHDAFRHLAMKPHEGSRLAECIPPINKQTLAEHLRENEPLKALIAEDPEYQDAMDLAVQIEGMIRGLGKHAGGVVIAPGPLEDYVPFYTEHSDGVAIAQLDKDDLEAVGLVKFDFLGLKTLTVMDWALAAINESRSPEEHVHLDTLPLDDPTTFDLIQNAHTDGVFQLESEGMRNTIRRLQPDRLEDLGVLNALYRPGPMANNAIESYGDRKKGIQEVIYPHPLLEPVLDKTYGEMVYQEDVMNVSRALAGFTLGKADLLRRAMGKKDSAKMQETKAEFISGAKEKGVPEQIANEVFHRIEVFAEYAFPRAHAMSYALVAYQTAYLKANFFSEYMAAYMSTEFDSSDANKMASLFRELDRVNVRILPPSVNKSGVLFTTEQGKIRFGLATIKGIGEDLARGIVEERKNGAYKDVADFCSRVSLEKVNESVVEKMIQCGALDELYPQSCDVCLGRAWLIESCNLGLRSEKEKVKQKANGVVGLFGEDQATPTLDLKSVVPLSWEELASTENKLLSFTFTVSLSDHFSEECRHISDYPLSDLKPTNGRSRTRIAGKVVKVNRVVTNNGNVMLRSTLQDGAANCDVAFFDNVDETESRLNELDYAVVECQVSNGNNGRLRVNGRKLLSLEEARDKWGKQLNVRFNGDSCDKFSAVADLLQQHKGKKGFSFVIETDEQQYELKAGADWKVSMSDGLLSELAQILSPHAVWVDYKSSS